VKADGLALGKGVLICANEIEANKAVDEILVGKSFGVAGAKIVIQEFLEGMEISLHAICDGKTAKLFPTSQDHKRALDGDQGLNTGGMGTYSPTPFLSDAELKKVGNAILNPWLRGCAAEKIDFRGILYPGVMLTKSGPKILEFNARFGDPETQVYLTRLENDLVELLDASVDGTLDKMELKWKPAASVCVVMASGGYPGNYAKGKIIHGLDKVAKLPDVKVFHAGTAKNGNEIVTNGGSRSRRDGVGQGFENRASRRLRRRGKNPFRRRAVPPRHRGEGVCWVSGLAVILFRALCCRNTPTSPRSFKTSDGF
jgi:phosphoribosylamine--glycine ligase